MGRNGISASLAAMQRKRAVTSARFRAVQFSKFRDHLADLGRERGDCLDSTNLLHLPVESRFVSCRSASAWSGDGTVPCVNGPVFWAKDNFAADVASQRQ